MKSHRDLECDCCGKIIPANTEFDFKNGDFLYPGHTIPDIFAEKPVPIPDFFEGLPLFSANEKEYRSVKQYNLFEGW